MVIPLVGFEVILGGVAEEVGDNEQSNIRSFSFRPCQKVVEFLGGYSLDVMLAVDEPAFAASALVNVGTMQVSYDVPTAVSGAGLLACSFTLIEVDEAQLFQQIECEFFEVCVRQLVERQPMLRWSHA